MNTIVSGGNAAQIRQSVLLWRELTILWLVCREKNR